MDRIHGWIRHVLQASLITATVWCPGIGIAAAGPEPEVNDAAIREEISRMTEEYAVLTARLEALASTPRIVVDTAGCELRFRVDGVDAIVAPCSAGSGRSLRDPLTGDAWTFLTPHGQFRILSKLRKPIWRKPDWAFIEEGLRPPADNRNRFEANVLGDYALGFGDGYFIHGTLYTRLIGQNVTHGCIRLDSAPLEALYRNASIGMTLLIF